MRRSAILLAMVILSISLSGCISEGEESAVEWDIAIYGDVSNPATLPYEDMLKMPHSPMEKKILNGTENYGGVALSEIVGMVGPLAGVDTVNCIASDGYILSFTLSDFENGYLITEKEGKPLDDEIGGPVMLGFNVGCACDWMKRVEKIEFFKRSDALGIIGDVTNPMYLTIEDIRSITGKENDFAVQELFDKAAYYKQSQTFSIYSPTDEVSFPIEDIMEALVTFENGSFSVTVDGVTYDGAESIDCVWYPLS